MENILHDFNENVISLMVEFLKNSIMEGGLSNFTDDLNDKLMKLGFDLTICRRCNIQFEGKKNRI